MSVDGDMEVINEDDNNINDNDLVQDLLRHESITFQCIICLEEFVHEQAHMQHMSMHLQNSDGDDVCDTSKVCKPHTAVRSSSAHSSLITENKHADPSPSSHAAQTVVPPYASLVTNYETNPFEAVDTNVSRRYKRLTDCFVKLYDIFAKKVVQRRDVSLMKTQRDAISCDSLNTVSKDFSHHSTSENLMPTTEYIEPVTNSASIVKDVVLKTLQSNSSNNAINILCINSSLSSSHTENTSFICENCGKKFKQKSLLVKHIETHVQVRRVTCKICSYKCKYQTQLAHQMRTHTGEKPHACELCEYKCVQKNNLVRHMRIHTGEKPYSCQICEYKCSDKSSLVYHMKTYTGEMPFTCNICKSKFALSSLLVYHMRTHTGIKPYACELCVYKCVQKCGLVRHMRTHTGEKPFTCNICNSKFAERSHLVRHMKTHTGEKPFTCSICNSKFAQRHHLVRHMRTHTGDNPLSRLSPPPENAQEMHSTADSV